MNQHRTYADLRREEMRYHLDHAQREFDRQDGPAKMTAAQWIVASAITLIILTEVAWGIYLKAGF